MVSYKLILLYFYFIFTLFLFKKFHFIEGGTKIIYINNVLSLTLKKIYIIDKEFLIAQLINRINLLLFQSFDFVLDW